MLNDSSIATVSQNASAAITSALNTPGGIADITKSNWEKIVKIIAKEIFDEIKRNAVVEVKELNSISVQGTSLVAPPGGGPVLGAILPASTVDLKGKIT